MIHVKRKSIRPKATTLNRIQHCRWRLARLDCATLTLSVLGKGPPVVTKARAQSYDEDLLIGYGTHPNARLACPEIIRVPTQDAQPIVYLPPNRWAAE